MTFRNAYEDADYAGAYAKLEFPGTYFLAFRDLPAIVAAHVSGRRALDFGCGAGRSTRFLRRLGFEATGADVAEDMLAQARALDRAGDYRLVRDGAYAALGEHGFDLIFSAFTFDNVPLAAKPVIFEGLRRLLTPHGRIVNLVSSPELYSLEWASFSTKDFPENRLARNGEVVRCVNLSLGDRRPVDDVVMTDAGYRDVYASARLEPVVTHRPLARGDEPCTWVNETRVPPWVIYVLRAAP